MKTKYLIMSILFVFVSGCLTFDTHREGSKVLVGLSFDSKDIGSSIDMAIKKANVALDKVLPGE